MKHQHRSWLVVACLLANGSPTVAVCKLGPIATLSVTMHGLHPTAIVQVNGPDVSLQVETALFDSAITPAAARRLHVKISSMHLGYDSRTVDIGGSQLTMQGADIDRLTIDRQSFPKTRFVVGDSDFGPDSVGLIGYDILGVSDTEYDLANGAIRLIRSYGGEREDLPYWGGPT